MPPKQEPHDKIIKTYIQPTSQTPVNEPSEKDRKLQSRFYVIG